MRILVADLVVELNPKQDNLKAFAAPFLYTGSRATDITLNVSDGYIDDLLSRAAPGSTIGQMENFAYSVQFNRRAIAHRVMLVHSSAVIYDGGAYLFSAESGVGKSTHTKLWLQAFGEKVHIMNDDKPVVRIYDDHVLACGTPFDGGSGIALNETYPLKAIVFLERGEENSVRRPDSREVLKNLYFQTAHMVNAADADKMLQNFERLMAITPFYILTCNMDVSAAYTAFDAIIGQKNTGTPK